VCSNWLQTFRNPGAPVAPTDWVSGDNAWVWGMDGSRCEARFISTRGKPWDIMLWSFYCQQGMGQPDSPWTFKPVQMLQQEAAVTLALGGNVQVYESPGGVRSGQLIPWRMERIGEMAAFVKERRKVCQGTETIPQVAVLHSEHHTRQHMDRNLMWGVDTLPVQGAVFSLLECHYNVDVLDEWALLPRLAEFPAVVVPEQEDLSDVMAGALKEYVHQGGKLLLSGAGALKKFDPAFIGANLNETLPAGAYHVPAGSGSVPVYSAAWQALEPTSAKAHGRLGKTSLLDDRLLDAPAWTLHEVGKGAVAYIPFDVFRSFERNRYPILRQFINGVAKKLIGKLPIRVKAPTAVDVVLRRKADCIIIHLINRSSGLPNSPNAGGVDEIPPAGPIRIRLDLGHEPGSIELMFENGKLKGKFNAKKRGGCLTLKLNKVDIHAAIVIEPAA
jgi:hypothetical protein